MPYTRDQFVNEYYGAERRKSVIRERYSNQRSDDAMAEMAAARFDTIGGEQAGYWAQQIRQDPRAALKLSDQYGGFGAIEGGLISAKSAAEAERLERSQNESMAGVVSAVGGQFGGTAGTGRDSLDEARDPNIRGGHPATDPTVPLWRPGIDGSGYAPRPAAGGTPRRATQADLVAMLVANHGPEAGKSALGLAETLRNLNSQPEYKSDKAIDGMRRYVEGPNKGEPVHPGVSRLTPEDRRNLTTRRARYADQFVDTYKHFKTAMAADTDSPEWSQILTILVNKLAQPDSAVLQGEADATARGLMSRMRGFMRKVEGVWTPNTDLDSEARERLQGLVQELAAVHMEDFVETQDQWQTQNREAYRFDGDIDEFTRPQSWRVEGVRRQLDSIRGKDGDARGAASRQIDDSARNTVSQATQHLQKQFGRRPTPEEVHGYLQQGTNGGAR